MQDHSSPTGQPASVYRMYNKAGVLIYVGLTSRGHTRQAEHLASKSWATEIAETHWEHFETRDIAAARERALITSQNPRHNVMHRVADTEPDRIEFRLRAEQYDLLKLAKEELRQLTRDFNDFRASYTYRSETLERILFAVTAAVKRGRPLSAADMTAANKYLTYLALDASARKVCEYAYAKRRKDARQSKREREERERKALGA